MTRTALTFNREIFLVETGYPYRPVDSGPVGGRGGRHMVWPLTPSGQAKFLEDVVQAVYETPHGKGIGVLWWHPEAIPVDRLTVLNATALFDERGKALPALKLFKKIRQRLGSSFHPGGDVSSLTEIERLGGVYSDVDM